MSISAVMSDGNNSIEFLLLPTIYFILFFVYICVNSVSGETDEEWLNWVMLFIRMYIQAYMNMLPGGTADAIVLTASYSIRMF